MAKSKTAAAATGIDLVIHHHQQRGAPGIHTTISKKLMDSGCKMLVPGVSSWRHYTR
jgi:hypothetical protein